MTRRREAELDDTGDSAFVRIWTEHMDDLLLEQIAVARKRLGVFFCQDGWNDRCWHRVLLNLQLLSHTFNSLNIGDLQLRAYCIKHGTNVDYSTLNVDSIPPEQQKYYAAFKVGELPPPLDPKLAPKRRKPAGININPPDPKLAPKRRRPAGTNVNLQSTRKNRHATNVSDGGSSMGSSDGRLAAHMLLLQDRLTPDEFSVLITNGKMGCFKVQMACLQLHELVGDDYFVAALKKTAQILLTRPTEPSAT